MFSSFVSDSGATYRSLVFPDTMSSFTCSMATLLNIELMKWAMPSCSLMLRMASTWFFINAIKGDMTIAVPFISNEGSW